MATPAAANLPSAPRPAVMIGEQQNARLAFGKPKSYTEISILNIASKRIETIFLRIVADTECSHSPECEPCSGTLYLMC